MVQSCSTNTYFIRFTDSSTRIITVRKGGLLTDELDIALPGKSRLEYGEIFNENVLHLLEHFACPQDPVAIPTRPDFNAAVENILENPTRGQLWYNTTEQRPYFYDSSISQWIPLGSLDDYGGNHGIILHGQQLPRPVSVITGYVFPYEECIWNVSPYNYDGKIDYMRCYTDTDSTVTMQYRLSTESSLTNSFVNYQIMGIRGNSNQGEVDTTPLPIPSPTPGASVTPTPTSSPIVGVSPTPSVTPSISVTPSPGTSLTPTPTMTRTVTPTPSTTRTPAGTLAPSPTPSETPLPTPPPTPTSSITPTPSRTPSSTPAPSSNPFSAGIVNNSWGPELSAFCDLNIGSCFPFSQSSSGGGCQIPLQFRASGGAPPYTLTFNNGFVSSGLLSPTLGFSLSPMSSGGYVTLNAAMPFASWSRTMSAPNAPSPGSGGRSTCSDEIPTGSAWADVLLVSTVGDIAESASGSITWTITDSVGNNASGTTSWSITRAAGIV